MDEAPLVNRVAARMIACYSGNLLEYLLEREYEERLCNDRASADAWLQLAIEAARQLRGRGRGD
jgi:hypothetical protein